MESPNSGQKLDIGWNHCESLKEGGRVHIKCKYCGKVFKGGGIYRFKEHLAGRKGGGPACQSVPSDVCHLIEQTLDSFSAKAVTRQTAKLKKQAFVSPSNDHNQGLGLGFESPPPQSVTPNQTVLPSPSTRQKTDAAWKYCQMIKADGNGRVHIKCNYCAKVFRGGGISRFKEHLAGRPGSAPICYNVPPDVRLLTQQSLSDVGGRLKKQKLNNGGSSAAVEVSFNHPIEDSGDDDGDRFCADGLGVYEPNHNVALDEENGMNNVKLDSRRRERGNLQSNVELNIVENPIQLTIGRFLYDIGANIDALDSVYFQRLIDSLSSGLQAPPSHEIRGWILKNLVEEVRHDINQYRKTWAKNGCSVIIEELNIGSGRTVLNFLVNCSQGTVFLKSVDSSSVLYSLDALYEFIKSVIEEVGVSNVLQVITNNEEHYNMVGKRLMETFPSLYWAPCVFHCIDQILEDFGKLEWINVVIEQARSITRFIYNHSGVLNLMRTFTFGKDIIQQGLTRAATNFMMLQRLADFKLNLQTMVTSQEWMDSPYAKQLGGLAILDIISNRSFWSSCILIIRLTSQLLNVLAIASSRKKAAMGFVLAGMYRAKESIKRELVKREDYLFYWNMIDERWNQYRHPPPVVAGFFLNPKFFYSVDEDVHNEMRSSVFDCIEKLVPDSEVQDKIAKELNFYKDAVGDLGRKMAVRSRDTLLPAEWWVTYGGGCPNLSRLAIKILSQTCCSIGCKNNQISFEKVYATANSLERRRLGDIVFVQYNLRLREMIDENKNQPISFDNIGIVEDWIGQNELCLEEHESSDWMALVASSSPGVAAPAPADETEEMSFGFGDPEIFDGLKKFKEVR